MPANCILLFAWLFFPLGCSTPENKVNSDSRLPSTDTSLYTFNRKDAGNKTKTIKQAHNEHYVAISIQDMKFIPKNVIVQRGDTVEWINNDITTHCVSEINKAWTSSQIISGASWKKVITENADYYCAIHLVMKGKVEVK